MKISAPRSVRRLTLPACALAVLTTVAPADAKPAVAELRVQAEHRTLAPGQSYLTDATGISTDTREPACGGSGKAATVDGPTALSLLIDAASITRPLRPLGISDKFDFGLLVCSIGRSEASDQAFWLYKVNHVAPEVGAEQRKIRPGDEVLWYFSNTATGRNTGDELVLKAPARVKPFTTFDVKVTAYDFAGKRTPAAGAEVVYGQQKVTTDAQGVAEVTSGSDAFKLRAVRGNDIASKTAPVCVAKRLRDCAARRIIAINGTAGNDRIKGGRGPEELKGYGGRDRIDVRGGGRDVVLCGGGIDRALVDRNDAFGRSCEFVNGKRLSRSAPRR